MKKILFLLVLLCCYGCSETETETETEMNENTAQQLYNSVKGTYVGNVMVDNIPQKIHITLGNDLTVKYLPVRPLLERIFNNGAALDAAEKSAGAVVFTAPIENMVVPYSTGGSIYLILEPTDLVFSVTADGKTCAVSALIEGQIHANRVYDELSMYLNVKELHCDGTSYDMTTNGVSYYVDNAKKE
jgi:hypothetical protein